jgi:hypothetical protein
VKDSAGQAHSPYSVNRRRLARGFMILGLWSIAATFVYRIAFASELSNLSIWWTANVSSLFHLFIGGTFLLSATGLKSGRFPTWALGGVVGLMIYALLQWTVAVFAVVLPDGYLTLALSTPFAFGYFIWNPVYSVLLQVLGGVKHWVSNLETNVLSSLPFIVLGMVYGFMGKSFWRIILALVLTAIFLIFNAFMCFLSRYLRTRDSHALSYNSLDWTM